MALQASHRPCATVEETKHLLSEREATKSVLGSMLAQLERCNQQAAALEGIYSGLLDSTEDPGHGDDDQFADQDEVAIKLAGLHALIQQKEQQLKVLESGNWGESITANFLNFHCIMLNLLARALTANRRCCKACRFG